MENSVALFLFLSVYLVGAVMHFAVIGRSLGLAHGLWLAPVALAVLVSAALHVTRV